jgi:uncharacterized membrane protein
MRQQPGWTDEKTEAVIGNLLRAGVLLSAAVVLLGAILYLWSNRGPHPDLHTFRSEPAYLRSVDDVARSTMHKDSRGIMQLGLLFLVLTPIARVFFAAVAFAMERDFAYVVISLFVLAVLIYSLTGSP